MKEKISVKQIGIIAYIVLAIAFFAVVLIIPQSREVFKQLSSDHPYLMGFGKFALLATSGELIAAWIVNSKPVLPIKIVWRFIIWGIIGMWITFMMGIFSMAAATLMSNGTLPGGSNSFLKALYTSVIMNTTFGPTFMALHKCSDMFLELRSEKKKASLNAVMNEIDWSRFAGFTILKTVPFFWIPAHTVTFLLPKEYQVIMAAALSIALGIILSVGNKKKVSMEVK